MLLKILTLPLVILREEWVVLLGWQPALACLGLRWSPWTQNFVSAKPRKAQAHTARRGWLPWLLLWLNLTLNIVLVSVKFTCLMAHVLRSLITVDGMWDLWRIIANGTNVLLAVRLTVIQGKYQWLNEREEATRQWSSSEPVCICKYRSCLYGVKLLYLKFKFSW